MTIPKIITLKNVIIAGLIIFILYLSFCNKPVIPEPVIISVPTQEKIVKLDSIASQKFKDSVIKIANYWQSQSKKWESNWNKEVNTSASLLVEIGNGLNVDVPDTCEKFKQKALSELARIAAQSAKKDTACSKTIQAKNNIITQKDVLIKNGKADYTKLRINLDTCFSQQTKLEKYLKKIKPKREVIAGISMLTNYNVFKPQLGLVVGYRNKAGVELNLGVYTNQQATITIKKPLFRF